jgi:hypothetical protein
MMYHGFMILIQALTLPHKDRRMETLKVCVKVEESRVCNSLEMHGHSLGLDLLGWGELLSPGRWRLGLCTTVLAFATSFS